MVKIEAKGKIYGLGTIVVCEIGENGHLSATFDGKRDQGMWQKLVSLLKRKFIVAGSYAPSNAYSSINIYNVLKYHLFDDPPQVEVLEGEIEFMPGEEGVIY